MPSEVAEKVSPNPLTVKLTPSQQVALDELRYTERKSRSQITDDALGEYFKRRGKSWPIAMRKAS